MSDAAFALNLGNGLYLDSNGNLHRGTPPDVPAFKAPFELPIDPDKTKTALEGFGKALSELDKDKDIALVFHVWKMDTKILEVLKVAGQIASALASVAAAFGVAVEIAKLFGFLKDGPSALELLVKERFDKLDREVKAISDQIKTNDLKNSRIKVEVFVAAIRNYLAQLNNLGLDLSHLEADRRRLLLEHAAFVEGTSSLLDAQTWLSLLNPADHAGTWGTMQGFLFTHPGPPGAPPTPMPLPQAGLQFDHRLMVPMVIFAAESYLTSIRGISPEYRTTGDFRNELRVFADKLATLAQKMRENVLARTIYKPEHFMRPVPPTDVVDLRAFGLDPKVAGHSSLWPVGSLDLRYHDDVYFQPFLKELWNAGMKGWPHDTKYAGLNFRWTPPARLKPGNFGNFTITNPDECAAAANVQSEMDYAELLSVSGYFELLRLATLFRNEASEPNRSQTVSAGFPDLYRKSLPAEDVLVQSAPVAFTGKIIHANGKQEPQECVAVASIRTQPLNRGLPIRYKVRLRTLASIMSPTVWTERTYADHQVVRYEDDAAHPGFKILSLTVGTPEVGVHELVDDWTSSPRDGAIHQEGVAEMMADTFDWWIPVAPPFSVKIPFKDTVTELHSRGIGFDRFGNVPLPVPGGMQFLYDKHPISQIGTDEPEKRLTPWLFWKPGDKSWDGQHRDLKRQKVNVSYSLDWSGDRLEVTLRNDPADRDYVVYVVVEELMPGSGKILHTAVQVPMNGQLTYVPEKFFSDEFAAHAGTAKKILELAGKVVPTKDDIGPPNPIDQLRPGDLASFDTLNSIAAYVQENHPDLVSPARGRLRRDGPAKGDGKEPVASLTKPGSAATTRAKSSRTKASDG